MNSKQPLRDQICLILAYRGLAPRIETANRHSRREGEPGIAGLVTLFGAKVTAVGDPNGPVIMSVATCPAGKVALSGGYQNNRFVRMAGSFRTASGTGWEAHGVVLSGGGTLGITAQVTCAFVN